MSAPSSAGKLGVIRVIGEGWSGELASISPIGGVLGGELVPISVVVGRSYPINPFRAA